MDMIHKGLVTLLRSAVTGCALELPEGFVIEDAFPIIKKQHLVALAFQGALNCGIPKDTQPMQQLLGGYIRQTIRSEKQTRAIGRIFRAFEENGIDHMPVKGCNQKSLYPKPELRFMGDADILIRVEQYDKVRQIMVDLGFAEKAETPHELVWDSGDLHLELHKCLFAPKEKEFYSYFGTGWDMAVKGEGTRYSLPPEDTFVYLFTHMAKHYRYGGIGSQHILDLYVFRQAHPGMDEARIEAAMEKLRLLEFYRNIRRLLAVWFEDHAPDEITEHITAYIFSGGSWGKLENKMASTMLRETGEVRHAKSRTLLRTIFLPLDALAEKYKILKKWPVLFPVFWVVRWFEVLFCRPQRIGTMMRGAIGMTDDKVIARREALNYVGLDFYDE